MSEFEEYYNKELGRLRTVKIDGETWFVAKDILIALYSEYDYDDVRKLDREEYDLMPIDEDVYGYIVSVSGMYALIIKSDSCKANELKQWITHKVIPGKKTSIDDKLTEISNKLDTMRQNMELYQAAQMLSDNGVDISYEEFVIYLRNHGYLMKNTELDLATNESMDDGIMIISARRFNSQGAIDYKHVHTYVTPKGQDYFLKLFRENEIL